MKTETEELQKELEQAELDKIRAIDRVKDLKAQIAEAEKEPSIFELMPIDSVWYGFKVVRHDKNSKNTPVGLNHSVVAGLVYWPDLSNLHKLIAKQKEMDAMKRFSNAASDYCKTHIFNNETLYDAYLEYNLVIEKEEK
jgi:hypothetical protein